MAIGRAAFTLIEILVAMVIVGVVAAFALISLGHAREAARRAQCASNLRQIGLALATYHDVHRSFPPAVIWAPPGEPLGEGQLPIGVIDRVARFGDPSQDTIYANWLLMLLPQLELAALAARFDAQRPISHANNLAVRNAMLAVVTCPSDPFNVSDNLYARGSAVGLLDNTYARGNVALNAGPDGNCLSGVVNEEGPCVAGFLTAGGDLRTRNRQVWGSGIGGVNRSFRMRDITDGTSHTVACDEIRAGVDPLDPRGTWALGQIGASALARHGMHDDAGRPNHDSPAGEAFIGCTALTDKLGARNLVADRMGCYSVGLEYERNVQAGARSLHPGGVHVLLCDGSARFIADDIQPETWHAMHTRDRGDH